MWGVLRYVQDPEERTVEGTVEETDEEVGEEA